MSEEELLKLAAENLAESYAEIVKMAGNPKHMNLDSREMKEARETAANRLTVCFTLKNAVRDIKVRC